MTTTDQAATTDTNRPAAAGAYQLRRHLDAPVDAAWQVLTCRAGARRWLQDPVHDGLAIGAAIPVWGSPPGQVVAVEEGVSIDAEFPDGRKASIAFKQAEHGCDVVITEHGAGGSSSLALGWERLMNAAQFVIDTTKENRRSRQAIVVVHGIGSQRPLSTVQGFTDALAQGSRRFSKPDLFSPSYELRRYQLPRTTRRPRTDLFELYWADKVPGTTLAQTMAWLRSLLFRRPKNVDDRLRPISYLTRAVALLLVVALGLLVIAIGLDGIGKLWSDVSTIAKIGWISAGLSIAGGIVTGFLVNSLGDVARYLEAKPDNIAVRQAIRQGGVSLFRRLHDEGGYDRIVVVGHSLGSVIAYDILKRYWAEVHRDHDATLTVEQGELTSVEDLLVHHSADLDRDTYRQTQRSVWQENRRLGFRWLVTDLVTVGSPLTYASTLLARSADHLARLQEELELPTCPPRLDGKGITRMDRYLVDGEQRSVRVLTHASMFAVVRWTNLYVPARAVVFGDPVGGPIAPAFGDGVEDVAVTSLPWWLRYTPSAHSSYWRLPARDGAPSAVPALVDAVDLDSETWLGPLIRKLPWSWSVETSEPGDAHARAR